MGIISNNSSEGVTSKLGKVITAIISVSILFVFCMGETRAFAADDETVAVQTEVQTTSDEKAPEQETTTAAATTTAVTVKTTASTTTTTTPKIKLGTPVFVGEAKYDSGATHPYNAQTSQLIVRYKSVKNAQKYQLFIKGGKYKKWTKIKTTTALKVKVKNLKRGTTYSFKVRAVNSTSKSEFSKVQKLSTAVMDYDVYGYQAICRIVFHEVGGMAGEMWDKPIVYVSDCVVNRFVAAKYTKTGVWASYYKRFNNVQDMIYLSGNFMSSGGLAADGAIYSRVPKRVKVAAYGALYNKTALNGIKNDSTVFYWCNRPYYSADSRIAYSFKIPWGYFNVWREYWA